MTSTNTHTSVPNPDDPSPSLEYTNRFQEMLNSDPLPSWEDFNSLLDEYILFIRKSVHVDNIPPRTAPRQDSPDNPKFIQSLYRRNRRRAVRKVIGENTVPCPLNPQDLSNHFFKSAPLDFDLSIYDDW